MPLYDYQCSTCGPFRAFKPLRESASPADCPGCSKAAQKMIVAPFLADMNPHDRIAHQRNEKSAHEPQVVSAAELNRSAASCSHGHGHSHHDHGAHRPSANAWVQSSRKWMIGH